jgi:hypothetical protein
MCSCEREKAIDKMIEKLTSHPFYATGSTQLVKPYPLQELVRPTQPVSKPSFTFA